MIGNYCSRVKVTGGFDFETVNFIEFLLWGNALRLLVRQTGFSKPVFPQMMQRRLHQPNDLNEML